MLKTIRIESKPLRNAAHYFGCDFAGTELDPDYYAAAKARFERETAQVDMFSGAREE